MRKRMMSMVMGLLVAVLCADGRERMCFDFDWQFRLGEAGEWQEVQLPHDWSRTLEFDRKAGAAAGYLGGGMGYYRKTFRVPRAWSGERVALVFDGVYHQAKVRVNGHDAGGHLYGYTPFEIDLSEMLNYGGDNMVEVSVDRKENSRWYTGSGIYRHVWLSVKNKVNLMESGTYITTRKEVGGSWRVNVVSTVQTMAGGGPYTVSLRLRDGLREREVSRLQVAGGGVQDVKQQFAMRNPRIWDINHPDQYTLVTVISRGRRVLDRAEDRFGVREIRFDAHTGFSLNGRKVLLKGVCLHQDAGCLGVAVPDRSVVRRLQTLKRFGVNAIRCSHNPYSNEFLNTCDSLGLLVIDEAFDKWKSGYYAAWYDRNWQTDLGDMIRRDRNHPCIILWSIGNETAEATMKGDEGVGRARMMQDFVHQLEPSRLVMTAVQPGFNERFASVTDVIGYNYGEPSIVEDHRRYPERIFLTSEAYPYYTTVTPFKSRDYVARNPWNYVLQNDFLCGEFIWSGVDYWGESSGWPSKGWPSAPFDMCMHPKERAGYFGAMWNGEPRMGLYVLDYALNEDPGKDHWQAPGMIHDWTFPQYSDGRVLRIETPTNCDSVVLWDCVKNRKYGPCRPQDYENNTIVWHQPYLKGKILAIGYRNGLAVCRDSLVTTGEKATAFRVSADRGTIKADGQDLAYITVELVDDEGRRVRIDDRRITASVVGGGRLLGIDSGEMRRSDRLDSPSLPTWRGMAQVLAQSSRRAGTMEVTVSVAGLGSQTVNIVCQP